MQSSASSQIRRIGTTSRSIEFEAERADRILVSDQTVPSMSASTPRTNSHSDPPDGGKRCSSVLLNATKSNSDFWPFWNCDLVRTFSKWRVQMSWKAPRIVEVSVGMEINMYACAARK